MERQDWVEGELENQLQDKPTTQSSDACKVLPSNIVLKTKKVKIMENKIQFYNGCLNPDTTKDVTSFSDLTCCERDGRICSWRKSTWANRQRIRCFSASQLTANK